MIARHRGFGLVEIMVGLVVGLISMVVVMQVYTVFENQKRATTTGSDAQINGALALYLMEREVRAAGNGMSEGEPLKFPPLAGCTTNLYDSAGAYLVPNKTSPFVSTVVAAGTVSSVRLAPVIASDGGGGASDALSIAYGTSSITAPYTLSGDYAAGSTPIGLYSVTGISLNDMVALIQTNTGSGNAITPGTCSLLQVTTAPSCPTCTGGAGTCTGTITCTGSCTGCNVPVASGTRYNKGGGTGVGTFSSAATSPGYAHLNNLGQLNLVTYRISGNNLVADISKFGYDPLAAANVSNRTDFSPLASNIVNMQVQYGVDTSNPGTNLANCKTNPVPGVPILTTADADGVVDAWVDATGDWANDGATTPSLFNLRRIRAVRVGLVARSAVRASGKADDPCNTIAPVINWDSGPDMTPDLSADANWQCYRYKIFQTTIPVRNTLWSSTMNPASTASCGMRG